MVVPAVCAGLLGMGSNEGQLAAPYGLFKLLPRGLPGAGADFDEDYQAEEGTMPQNFGIGFHLLSSPSDQKTSPSTYT